MNAKKFRKIYKKLFKKYGSDLYMIIFLIIVLISLVLHVFLNINFEYMLIVLFVIYVVSSFFLPQAEGEKVPDRDPIINIKDMNKVKKIKKILRYVMFISLIIDFLVIIDVFSNFPNFLYVTLLFCFVISLGVYSELPLLPDGNLDEIKKGKLKYTPYVIDKEKFIRECKSGLIYSIVRINGEIYELEVQLDNISSKKYDNFICYLNNIKIIGLDNFLNYKYDGVHTLNELKHIEFLEYNNDNPKKYFDDKIV